MGRLTFLKRELQALYRRKAADDAVRASSVDDTRELGRHNSSQIRPLTAGNEFGASPEMHLLSSGSHENETEPASESACLTPASPTLTFEGRSDARDDQTTEHLTTKGVSSDDVIATHQDEVSSPIENAEGVVAEDGVEADPAPLTFEEEQAIRDEEYVTLAAEAAECYTDGPSRLVLASDGVKGCVALLMTLDFSGHVQEALQSQRDFAKARSQSSKTKLALIGLESKVESAIASCKSRLRKLDDQLEGDDRDARASLEQRLTILKAMLLDVGGRKQELFAGVQTQADILREVQASVIAYLEEAFICGMLVPMEEEDPAVEVKKFDLEEEYLLFCDKLKAAGDPLLEDEEIAPLDHNLDHLKAEPLSEEDQKKQDIVNDLWAAKQTLTQARNAFENRSNQRAQEFYANQAAADAGLPTTDDSPEAFDIRWVQETAGLTRALIDAEGAWTSAKRRAVDAGVPVEFDQDDQDTVFAGVDESDCGGDRMSAEQEMVPTVSSPTMRKWLSAVPEGVEAGIADDEAEAEADDWEADEVGISDSVSLVAEGRERARIDRWRRACMGEREA
ncbi:hypothetical protein WHR41_00066 [Cladosporium halotolerans]|uniref:Uncharacterized protein n=1 Tax=Cladosporium halotolerans TaxID=1052096 RepID=A0AB34L2D9_9PEZI